MLDELRLRIVVSNIPVKVETKAEEWKGIIVERICVMTCEVDGKSYAATGKSRDYDWKAYYDAKGELRGQLENDGIDFDFSDEED